MFLRLFRFEGLEFDSRIKSNLYAGGGCATGARGQVVQPQLACLLYTSDAADE